MLLNLREAFSPFRGYNNSEIIPIIINHSSDNYICPMRLRFQIEDMRIMAQQLGGKCLSKEYIDYFTPLAWMCERGHTWDASYSIISQGGWCRQCAKSEFKLEKYEELQQIAAAKGGRLLTPTYIDANTRMQWQCKEGHTWYTTPASLKHSHTWCFKCSVIVNAAKLRDSIEKYRKIAEKHGGKLLSKVYINSQTKLKWQCAKGHVWEAKPNNVFVSKSWCPLCAHTLKLTIEQMRALAKERGGKCLSTVYKDNKQYLKWQCDEGHTWLASAHGILLGNWCPGCQGKRVSEKLRADIKDIRALAQKRGGKLLSTEYINAVTPIKWQCSKGHQWMARAGNVKSGNWCPYCAGKMRHTIENLNKLAKERGGKCLSTMYVNRKIKLKWQCDKKHVWFTMPGNIVAGCWCPQCGHSKPRPRKVHTS